MISVCLCSHLNENERYLKAAVESLRWQRRVNLDVHVISSATQPNSIENETIVNNGSLIKITYHHEPTLNTATKKLNHAMDHYFSADTEGYLFLSDDVVLSRDHLASMQEAASVSPMIVGALSNNENYHRFFSNLPMPNPPVDFDQTLIEWVKAWPKGHLTLIRAPWISFYATYVPKVVWDRLGRLEDALDLRGNDYEYCQRAAAQKIPTFIHSGAFALHFGGRTISKAHSQEELDEASRQFGKICGILP